MQEKYAIIVAGGKGTRMGADKPKQFLEIDGKPILQHTVEKFKSADESVRIIVVLPKDHVETWKQLCYEKKCICPQTIVCGGITRFHSVRNALAKVPAGALVAVHDGVRPLASEQLILSLFDVAEKKGAAVPVTPCIETIKVLGDMDDEGLRQSRAGEHADRSVLFGAQTPQVFASDLLKAAYERPFDTSFTDDASVVEAAGGTVHYLLGERSNIKITTPEDLELAGFYLGRGK